MPPMRSSSGRASKACDLCRKCKTRCYTSSSGEGSCLRCETLSQVCSLRKRAREPVSSSSRGHGVSEPSGHDISVDDRFCCSNESQVHR